jgi:hypothetical protein
MALRKTSGAGMMLHAYKLSYLAGRTDQKS